jgi:hypothetical protein
MAETILVAGRVLGLVFGLIIFAATYFGLYRLGHLSIRRIPGFDYIEEIVGRAAEMGRPVHYIPGISGVTGSAAQRTIAGLACLGHTARLSARQGVRLFVSVAQAQILPIVDEIVRTAYDVEGVPDQYDPNLIRYTVNQRATMAYIQGMFPRERIAGNIMIGAFYWEAFNLAEMGSLVGAVQVAGETMSNSIPEFAVTCERLIIGDEVFASAALATGDEQQLGTIIGLDIIKVVVITFMVLGTLFAIVKNDVLLSLLGW